MNIDAMRRLAPSALPPATPTAVADIAWLLGAVFERLAACERRCGAGFVDHTGTAERLHRLVRGEVTGGTDTVLLELRRMQDRLAALEQAAADEQAGAVIAELVTRVAHLERLAHPAALATQAAPGQPPRRQSAKAPQRLAAGGPLRQAISHILVATPGADAKAVLRLLEACADGRPAPSLRTVRWHLQKLRCNTPHAGHRPATARGNGNGIRVLR